MSILTNSTQKTLFIKVCRFFLNAVLGDWKATNFSSDIKNGISGIYPKVGKCCEAMAIRLYNRYLAGMVKNNCVDETFKAKAIQFNKKQWFCNRRYDNDSSILHILSSVIPAINNNL